MTATPDTATGPLSPDPTDALRLSLIRLHEEVRDTITAFCSARPLRELSAPSSATVLVEQIMAKVAPPVENLWKSCDRYVHVIGTWRDECDRLIAGADTTPTEVGVAPTAGQFLHQLLAAPAEGRIHMLENLGKMARDGHHCGMQDHVGNIEDLMRRPTMSAFDTLAEAVDRRRVALVAVLGLPDDTSFEEAVDAAGVLAGARPTAEVIAAELDSLAAKGETTIASEAALFNEGEKVVLGAAMTALRHRAIELRGDMPAENGGE